MLALLSEATYSWEMKTNPFTSTVLRTYSQASYLASYPALGRQSTPPYSRVPGAQHAASLQNILEDLGYPQPPTIIMCDNTCAIGIATDSIKQKRSKAIDMRFHWVCDRVRQGQFTISYIQSADNIADYFTKNLDPIKYKFFMQFLASNDTKL
jgi:hypothetical protein